MIAWYYLPIAVVAVNVLWIALAVFKQRAYSKVLDKASDKVADMILRHNEERLPEENEGSLYRLFHEINSLAAILNAHVESRSKTNEFLKNTIEDISHQLKTPLAALNIYIGILQDEKTKEDERKKFVALAEKELERMEHMVQNLLAITKIDSGTINFNIKSESAEDMLLEVYERFNVRAEKEKKRLLLDTEDVSCLCDRYWTTEAIGNIVKNALDHTSEGGKIVLSSKTSGENCAICVEDDGEGISDEDIFYIFKRFYKSKNSPDISGVGLGLPLARSVIEKQSGQIDVNNKNKQGVTFSIFLPSKAKE